ncbi:hypothetical protein Tco_0535970 [Tanacetum coccineum]
MAAISNVPQLVDKKGGNYFAVASRLEPRKFSKWKKHDIMELVISYKTAKSTWTDLVHSFEAKPSEILSPTYTHYKTLLNELTNDGVIQSKHEINLGFMNSLVEKWLSFSQGLRNDFQKHFDDEADKRSSEEYPRDPELEFHERAFLANSKCFIKRKNKISSQKANENTKCYKCGKKSSQSEPKFQKDYKAEYKKMKAKLALLEASPSTSQSRDDLLSLKQENLEAVTFQIQNTKLTKLNYALQEKLKEERKVNEKWLTSSKKVSQCISEQILNQKKKILGGELLAESSSKNKAPTDPESSKELGSEPQTPLPPLKNLHGASPSSESISGPVTICDTEPVTSLVPTEVNINDQESKIDELTKLVQMLMDEKINST